MEQVKLKPVEPNDFDFIWDLYSNSIRPIIEKRINKWDDEEQKKQFKQIYSENDTKIIVKKSKRVGWIDYRLTDKHLKLVNGFIVPSERKKGIMSSILNNLIEKDMEVEASTLKGNPYNSFLEKFNFETIETDELTETRQLKK